MFKCCKCLSVSYAAAIFVFLIETLCVENEHCTIKTSYNKKNALNQNQSKNQINSKENQ
jgi:hypothetical protein